MLDRASIDQFFSGKPEVRPLFDALVERILAAYPDVAIDVQKSQISFCAPRPFCWAWLPIRDGIKGRPAHYLIITFGLNHKISHTRIAETVQPYPGRWTHHVIISQVAEIDVELMAWIDQAYQWKSH